MGYKFLDRWERFVRAPLGPVTSFYVAADVKFVKFSSSNVSANLTFGSLSKIDYAFQLLPSKAFILKRYDGTKYETVIERTPISFNPEEANRIAVAIEDQRIKLYFNSELLGEYEDFDFKGGKVGLSVANQGTEPLFAVLDFDNFEIRRKQ